MERDELIKWILDTYNQGDILASDIWNTDDIQSRADDLEENPNLSQEEAEAVIYKMEADEDCNVGLCNDFVYQKIQEVIDERDIEEDE